MLLDLCDPLDHPLHLLLGKSVQSVTKSHRPLPKLRKLERVALKTRRNSKMQPIRLENGCEPSQIEGVEERVVEAEQPVLHPRPL